MSPSPAPFLLPRGTGSIFGVLFHNLCDTLLLDGNQTNANPEMVDLWIRWQPIFHALSRTFRPLCELVINKRPHRGVGKSANIDNPLPHQIKAPIIHNPLV
jgi:hypothetical protein